MVPDVCLPHPCLPLLQIWHSHKYRRRKVASSPAVRNFGVGTHPARRPAKGRSARCEAKDNGAEEEKVSASKPQFVDQVEAVEEEQLPASAPSDGVVSAEDTRNQESSTLRKAPSLQDIIGSGFGRVAFEYFNWRKGTWNDLQLVLWLNLAIVLVGGIIKTVFVDMFAGAADEAAQNRIWQNFYQVVVVVFGQEFPDEAAGSAVQIFSLAVGAVGLAAFALVIALTEQLVLEVLDKNVKRGSKVYESGHVLVLGWVDNRRDEEVMWKILSQVCLAYRNDGGTTAVVLSHRPKLSMESQFEAIIPTEQRFGTRFVFRQGSPALPADLRKVAASSAAATIIVSDSTRSPEEADAQSLRAAVLLDELDFPGYDKPDPRTGHIIVELKQDGTDEILRYFCSKRVVPLMTNRMNAVRCARLVRHPVVGAVSQMLWSFNSASQGYLQPVPELEGRLFGPIFKFFPDGIVLGLTNPTTKKAIVNPPASQRIERGDQLVMMRPTNIGRYAYGPTRKPARAQIGSGWNPAAYLRGSVDDASISVAPTSIGELEGMVEGLEKFANTSKPTKPQRSKSGGRRSQVQLSKACAQLYMLPLEYIMSAPMEPERVLICGFGDFMFMVELIRALDKELPKGSDIMLFSDRTTRDTIGLLKEEANVQHASLLQMQGNPCRRRDLRKLAITRFRCAIILCDQAWMDPDMDNSNGIDERSQDAMLRLDAMVMRVQLNIRFLLEEAKAPDINIITEKVAFEGVTRFEDRNRLPLGTTVNFTAYSAKMLLQAAYNPNVLLPLSLFGQTSELLVQDAAALANEDEELTFWQLQARSATIGQILIGYVTIPKTIAEPLDLVINPIGDKVRSKMHTWNKGDQRTKLISLAPIDPVGTSPAGKDQKQQEGKEAEAAIATTTNMKAVQRPVGYPE